MSEALKDFFVQEASDYLDRLAAALAVDGHPDFDRIRRLARALRGSARMADQDAISRVAGALQSLAADLARGERKWDSELGGTLKRLLPEFRELIEDVHTQPPDLDQRAAGMVRRLGGATGQEGGGHSRTADSLADPELRDYLGDELQQIVSDIREAVRVLEREPRDREPLKRLLRRVRPLRGVQGLNELGAVGAALSALEEVILRIADTSATVGPGHLALFERAEQALSDVAEDLSQGDRPRGGAGRSEIEDLKEQVLEVAQREVVWISELFRDDEGPHIESCPMAERGAGSWESFFRLEATGSLDTADRLRAEMLQDGEGIRGLAQRLAYTFRQLRERALTFGHTELAGAARSVADHVRAGLDGGPGHLQAIADRLSAAIEAVRDYLDGAEEPDRRHALERVGQALEEAAAPDGAAVPPTADAPQAAGAPATAGAGDVVPIERLTYTPEDALARALELRDRALALVSNGGREPAARAVLEEVFDLIEHALERSGHDR